MDAEAFDELALRALDGAAGDEEHARLERALAGSAAARTRWVRLARQRASLVELLAPAAAQPTARPPRAPAQPLAATDPRRGPPRPRQAPATRRTARLRRRRGPSWWPMAMCAAAALLVVAVVWARQQPPPATVATLSDGGAARVTRAGRALAGGGLAAGDRIAAIAATTLRWPDGTTVQLTPGSDATLAPDAGTALRLDGGTLTAAVASQTSDRPFAVSTPLAGVTVLGTRFELSSAVDRSRLRVREGRVRLRGAAGDEAIVAAGEAGVARARGPLLLANAATARIDDFEAPALDPHWTVNGAQSISRLERVAGGADGGGHALSADLRIDGDPVGYATLCLNIGSEEPRDWSAWDGLALAFRGVGDGGLVAIELHCHAAPGHPLSWERFVWSFVDDAAGWRQVRLPWSVLARRDWQAEHAPRRGFDPGHITGLHLYPSPPRAMAFAVDDLRLELRP